MKHCIICKSSTASLLKRGGVFICRCALSCSSRELEQIDYGWRDRPKKRTATSGNEQNLAKDKG